jgi:hypothetical protein
MRDRILIYLEDNDESRGAVRTASTTSLSRLFCRTTGLRGQLSVASTGRKAESVFPSHVATST